MMHMGNSTGMGSSLFALWGLHVLATIAFTIGVILLIVWAAKILRPQQLKTWGLALAIIGLVLSLLTVGAYGAMRSSPGMMGKSSGMGMHMMGGMMGMMKGDADDMMGMSMADMSAMLEGKTGDDFDAAFLEGMIPHHQGAIDMANAALQNAKHEEVKNMARAIISAQQREIDQMHQWQQAWGYTE